MGRNALSALWETESFIFIRDVCVMSFFDREISKRLLARRKGLSMEWAGCRCCAK